MACAGNYDDYEDPDLDVSLKRIREAEQVFDINCTSDLQEFFGISRVDARAELNQSIRRSTFCQWPYPETTVAVVGVGKGIESEFAFQCKCPFIVYRCYIYNTPT